MTPEVKRGSGPRSGGGGAQALQIPGGVRGRRRDAARTRLTWPPLRRPARRQSTNLISYEATRSTLPSLRQTGTPLLDSLEAQAPERLDSLTPQERHQFYKLLKLRADVFADGRVEVSWTGAEGGEAVCQTATLSKSTAPGKRARRGAGRSGPGHSAAPYKPSSALSGRGPPPLGRHGPQAAPGVLPQRAAPRVGPGTDGNAVAIRIAS